MPTTHKRAYTPICACGIYKHTHMPTHTPRHKVRPGSIIGPQQQYLQNNESRMWALKRASAKGLGLAAAWPWRDAPLGDRMLRGDSYVSQGFVTRKELHTLKGTPAHAHTRAHTHTCTHAHMHTRTRAHAHTRTRTHAHTHTHARTPTQATLRDQ